VADDDTPSSPGTQAFKPDFDDDEDENTGTHSWTPDFSDDSGSQPVAVADKPDDAAPMQAAAEEPDAEKAAPETEASGVAVHSVTVRGRYQYVKWWKLALVILGAWVAAAEIGLSLFYWWFHTYDRTLTAYAVLVYVVACIVAAVMLAMVEGKPLISALSIGVMSGPFASVLAAAPLYGYYHCERVGHCLAGVIPY
jgi:hypothetical protein